MTRFKLPPPRIVGALDGTRMEPDGIHPSDSDAAFMGRVFEGEAASWMSFID